MRAGDAPATPMADAERWMALVDAGHYAESWSAAGTIFRQRITSEAWASAAGAVRTPLGVVLSRDMLSEKQVTSLPGAPDGAYDVIQFSTVFANKRAAIETIILTHEATGWRVDGYFVK